MKKLPKIVYVKWDGNDEPYLDARQTPDSFDNGDKVGIYQLVETKTQKITTEME